MLLANIKILKVMSISLMPSSKINILRRLFLSEIIFIIEESVTVVAKISGDKLMVSMSSKGVYPYFDLQDQCLLFSLPNKSKFNL